LGFLIGFGLYTYGIILFFIGAAALQVGVVWLRDVAGALRRHTRSTWIACTVVGVAVCCVGRAAWIMSIGQVATLPSAAVPPLQLARAGLGLALAAAALELAVRRGRQVLALVPAALLAAATFGIGYAPKLYYTYVQHGSTRERMALTFNWSAVRRHLGLLYEGHTHYLNVDAGAYSGTVAWLLATLLVIYFGASLIGLCRFIGGAGTRRSIVQIGAMPLLPFVIVPMFGLSASIMDWASARYSLPLWLFYATALATVTHRLMAQRQRMLQLMGAASAAGLLLFNATHLAAALTGPESRTYQGEAAVAALKARGVHYGYAWYWYAYSISLATQEDIILEPVSDHYNPYYAPLVHSAARLAIVQPDSLQMRQYPARVHLDGTLYIKTDAWQGDGMAFVVLERVDDAAPATTAPPA
jgi:hypothetical protein